MPTSKLRIGLIGLVFAGLCLAVGLGVASYAGLFGRGLRAVDPAARVAEATSLAERQRDDPAVDDALIAALADPSESVRAAVADTLGKRASRKAAQPLAAMLKDPAPAVRGAAAWSMWKVPNLDSSAETALRGAFSDSDPDVRRYVFLSLEWLARTAKTTDDPRVRQFQPLMLEAAKDPSPVVRRVALLALRDPPKGSLVDPQSALLAQIQCLSDADSSARTFAATGLPILLKTAGPKLSAPTLQALSVKVPMLVDGVINGDRDTRPMHQTALLAAGKAARANSFRADAPAAEKTKASLVRALAVPGPDVRPLILVALPALATLIGPDGKFIEDQLRSALAEPDLRPPSINAVRSALELADPSDEATGKMAIELLRPLLKDDKPMVRGSTYIALWQSPLTRKAGGDALRAELRAVTRTRIADLSSSDPETRDVAAWCLAWTDRDDADAALAALVAAREDKEPLVKEQIEFSITRLEAAKGTSSGWPDPSWGPFRRRGRRPR